MNRYQHEVAEMDRRHRQLVRGLSVAAAAVLVALAFWSAGWWPEEDPHERAAESAPIPVPPRPAVVAVRHDSKAQHGAGTDSSVSPRPQPLHLVATTPGRNKNDGTASIGVSRNNPQTYVAGALLVNGARIAEIHRDHVVLERDGKQVELYLHSAAANPPRAVDDLLMVGGTQPVAPTLPVTREVLTDYLRPSPVIDDEVIRGYQVYPGRKAQVFAQLGLRPGDVITSINDAPIVDAATAIEALKEVTNGANIAVRVERNGKSERLVLDGTLITGDLERDSSPAATTPVPGLAGA